MRTAFAFIALSLSLSLLSTAQAQSGNTAASGATRSRSATASSLPPVTALDDVVPTPQRKTGQSGTEPRNEISGVARPSSPAAIKARINDAERFLKTRPRQTSLTSPALDVVTLALIDRGSTRIHLLTLSKQSFLTKGSEVTLTTSLGTPVTLRVLRANGVNTALTVQDDTGRSLMPLLVEYPIEHKGVFKEMAYYTSAHPALLSTELVQAGQSYVRSMIDLAAKRLKEKGAFISPNIVDVAEHLCLVEHIDHDRFRNENRAALFNEIYSLYALNEVDTYRYSVSFAGAGGMVQMIPWAYNLIRQRHPAVGLIPDFVAGMRNQGNALQAMLLYMQDTWNDLAASDDVQYAIATKLATQTELLAAGYNSNAAKLPGYIRRGASDWRTLIPRETQMYLQIYRSLEGLVPMKPRTAVGSQEKSE